jgi:hypothetical protein
MGDEIKIGDKFTSRLPREVKGVEVLGFNNDYIEYRFLKDDGTPTCNDYQWVTSPNNFRKQFRPKED